MPALADLLPKANRTPRPTSPAKRLAIGVLKQALDDATKGRPVCAWALEPWAAMAGLRAEQVGHVFARIAARDAETLQLVAQLADKRKRAPSVPIVVPSESRRQAALKRWARVSPDERRAIGRKIHAGRAANGR
jgi:hypothetical protein